MNKIAKVFLFTIILFFVTGCELQQPSIIEHVEESDSKTLSAEKNNNSYLQWGYPNDLNNMKHRPSDLIDIALSNDRNTVYTNYFEGRLTAIDSKSGKELWNYYLPEGSDIVQIGVHPYNNDIYLMDLPNLQVWVLSYKGKLKNQISFGMSNYAIKMVPSFIFTKKGRCYFGAPDGKVYCVNDNGKILWATTVGRSKTSGEVYPVSDLAVTKDERTIVAAAFIEPTNPVYGIDADSGEIRWQYSHSKYTNINYITVDDKNNVLLAANDPKEMKRWNSTNPNEQEPPMEEMNSTVGGAIILLDANGREKKIIEIPGQFGLVHVKGDPKRNRIYATGYTCFDRLSAVWALFAADYEGKILWDILKYPILLAGYTNSEFLKLQDFYVYLGSYGDIKKIDIDGNLIAEYKILEERKSVISGVNLEGSASIIAADENEKSLYVFCGEEKHHEEYGSIGRIYKLKLMIN
ncbi:PQQ-binding-like beta-propeller repeat protein [Thermovorax subterraneus]|nr:PQQ-binding-like beta-propeller repeat protein [Thermovorax subterraneus]